MGIPAGNGYFIWLLERAAGGDPKRAAQMAKDAGLDWVAIKVADGGYAVNYSTAKIGKPSVDLVGPFVDAFRSAGVRVHGWDYVYGNYPEAEAAIAERRVKDFGLESYILDVEGEYKNKPVQASILMHRLREKITCPIGLCSFRFPVYHPEVPWNKFASCDYNMPQVYWMQATNAGSQLQISYSQFKKLPGYGAMPFISIGAFPTPGAGL